MNTGIAFILMFWIVAPILYCAYCASITHPVTNDTIQSLIRTILPTSPFLPRLLLTILGHLIMLQPSSPMASLTLSSMRRILPYF